MSGKKAGYTSCVTILEIVEHILKVTVFGGSSPKPGDRPYKEAETLGRMLGAEGHTVLTGGYMGCMEAVSKGASETGGHVIGVTCKEIERWRPLKANTYVMEEWECEKLSERIARLIDSCDAAIALPGGIGTLAEISVMWNRLVIHDLSPRPLIVVGNSWGDVLESFMNEQSDYLPVHDREFVSFASTIAEAADLIRQYSKNREKT